MKCLLRKRDDMLKQMPPRAFSLLCSLVLIVAVGSGSLLDHAQADDNCAPRNLRTSNWRTDFCNHIVDYNEILVGNPTKDGIPALTDPRMETIADASAWLVDRSPVIALEIEGDARAYPLAVLMWHEIANDQIGGLPVAVTFCPLCNSAIAFDRRVDEAVLDFGVSGLLRNSDLVMYDRQTESWWQQLTGEGLAGDYAGVLLDIVPAQVISFGAFAERHADGLVLSRATGYARQYGMNPYRGYDSRTSRPFLFDGEIDTRLPSPVDHVLAAIIDDTAVAYPFSILREAGVINDVLGEMPLVAFYQGGVASALGDAVIDNARDIGTASLYHAQVDGLILEFARGESGGFVDAQTGSSWNAFGEAIDGELAGAQLEWINAFPHFWFAWAAFYPDTLVYGMDG
ncbi:MAG: DUF3179 domain-containing protein [Chloroflexi bacterium]|nr:DUF3179 domain-containing protein [Chloroflexota bacterium]MXX50458.1 DUF3179 domain-containing protein [Chloroflexota bacterium]